MLLRSSGEEIESTFGRALAQPMNQQLLTPYDEDTWVKFPSAWKVSGDAPWESRIRYKTP